jgi:hypothetical protein
MTASIPLALYTPASHEDLTRNDEKTPFNLDG